MNTLKVIFGNIALVVYIITVFLVGQENIYYYPLILISSFASSYWIQYAIYLIIKDYFRNSESLLDTPSFPQGKRVYSFLSLWGIYLFENKSKSERTVKLALKENVKSMFLISIVVACMCLVNTLLIFVLLLIPGVPLILILKQYEIDGRLKA